MSPSDVLSTVEHDSDSLYTGPSDWLNSSLFESPFIEELEPRAYSVDLHPNASSKDFKGFVFIVAKIVKDTQILRFHKKRLNITSIELIDRGQNESISVLAEYTKDGLPETQFLLMDRKLPANDEVQLNIGFSGVMNQFWKGMYYKSYFFNGKERRSIFTEGEPYLLFPCMNQENLVALIDLFIIHEDHVTCLSNAAPESTRPYNQSDRSEARIYGSSAPDFQNLTVTHFFVPRGIPPHAVAFYIGDFARAHKPALHHEVNVYAPPHQIHMAQFALDLSVELLDKYDAYFEDTTIYNRKLDIVAAGNRDGFSSYGLIFMSGANLLHHEGGSPDAQRKEAAYQLAVLIAKQWFGNLYTMSLTGRYSVFEGFAAYTANLALQDLGYISSQELDQKYEEWRREIMEHDGLYTILQAGALYAHQRDKSYNDEFSLKKGALILKMFEPITSGSESIMAAFRTLSEHSQRFNFGQDFLSAECPNTVWNECSGPIHVRDWFFERGYPVLNLSRVGSTVHYTQERFMNNKRWVHSRNYTRVWTIPFTYVTSANPEEVATVILNANAAGTFEVPASAVWVKGKAFKSSLYRVNYDAAGWEALRQQLLQDHTVLPAGDRASLIEDAFALAKARMVSYATLFNLLAYIGNETDVTVRKVAAEGLMLIKGALSEDRDKTLVARYLTALHLDGVGMDETDDSSRCGCHIQEKDSASLLYKSWKRNSSTHIPSADVANVFTFGAGREREDWDVLFYRSTLLPQDAIKLSMQRALACTRSVVQITRLLNYCLDPAKIDLNLVTTIVQPLRCNRGGLLVLLRFIRKNKQKLIDMFDSKIESYILEPIFKPFRGLESAFDLSELKLAVQNIGFTTLGRQALESLQDKVDWRANCTVEIRNFLESSLPSD